MTDDETKTSYVFAVGLILLLTVFMTGCKTGAEREIDKLKKPVHVASIGDGHVVLRGAQGNICALPASYVIAKSISKGGLKAGDVYIP